MAEKKIDVAATAKVQVTLEVEVGHWGGECDTQQVFDQSAREAVQTLYHVFEQAARGTASAGTTDRSLGKLARNVRLVGKPKVTMILVRERD